jgi:hypothetical protein
MTDADRQSPDEEQQCAGEAPLELEPRAADLPNGSDRQSRGHAHEEPGGPTDPIAGDARPNRDRGFSLAQLFLLVVVVSVFLAVIRCFSAHIAAGLAGLAVLVGLVLMSLGDPPVIVQLTWWALLAVYLMAAGLAVLRG